ncbi:MAG: hypothetical protein PHY72_03590 [Candidatus Pacebacteria bacterium]|nr:hypothetical protein [Candidatus Paceibacterota bacterium]
MNKNIGFVRKLIKGKIAEVIFEQMMREEGRYTIIPFGYEHTMPTLAQYRSLVKVQTIIDNIADAPDFVLISHDKTEVYLVEVKYQSKLNIEDLKGYAKKLIERWEYPWLFVATPSGFKCGLCKKVLEEGAIGDLSENLVSYKSQAEYLKVLLEFER